VLFAVLTEPLVSANPVTPAFAFGVAAPRERGAALTATMQGRNRNGPKWCLVPQAAQLPASKNNG